MTGASRRALFALETFGIKLGLEQIRALLELLGHPERSYPSLVIAGTNGKGSVTAMVERGLRAAGYRTGRYISPHLVHLEERFAIDGQPISSARLDSLAEKVMDVAASLPAPPSFFEATTAIALEEFRRDAVDVAVLEVGLGGRLDATNAVDSKAVAITAVDFDHQMHLGSTIEEISREKAGVIKRGGLTILGENPSPVCRIIIEVASLVGSDLVYAADGVAAETEMIDGRITASIATPRASYAGLTLALRGRHQVANAITAIRLLEELDARRMFVIPQEAIRTGVEQAVWPARLELIERDGRQVLIDGAHNPAGARSLATYVLEVFERPLPMVLGVMRDKEIDEIVRALAPAASHFICTAAQSPRAATPAELADAVSRVAPAIPVTIADRAAHALAAARDMGPTTVVAGSLYLAGEIRAELM
ncbi:MAG TPA: folylpolyglutamate synthase/dihydrofolate synthase family protein [Vicinamibacterales bacterium]|nr:folylpolyglutamate synthase/dihydrofolate synthase family protein [Vicinamibacterales bacterium]